MSDTTNPFITIAGTGCVLPSGWGVSDFWTAVLNSSGSCTRLNSVLFHSKWIQGFCRVADTVHQRSCADVLKKLQRYCSPSVLWGVSAVKQALQDAGLEPDQDGLRYGLYCCQGGYTYPSLTTYSELLQECRDDQGTDLFMLTRRILQDGALDPFLVLKSLNNGLLGVVSLTLQLKCECNAYMQGVTGNSAAVREACSALRQGRIDAAIVVGAGSEFDAFSLVELVQAGVIGVGNSQTLLPFDQNGKGGIAGEGAVALVLRRSDELLPGPQIYLDNLKTHTRLEKLLLPQRPLDLVVCAGSGEPERDNWLAQMLSRMNMEHITSALPATGILSGAPMLVDMLLAYEALRHQRVPPIAGLRQPVTARLPFTTDIIYPEALHHCAVLSCDMNGYGAICQMHYRDTSSHQTH